MSSVLLVAVSIFLATSSSAAGGVSNGVIVFATEDPMSDSWDIFATDPQGGQQSRIDSHPSGDFAPVVSPEGGRIAFVSYRDGALRLYVMTTEGSALRQVSPKRFLGTPLLTWSPDGKKIALHSKDHRDVYQLYVVTISNGRTRRVTAFRPREDSLINPGVYSPEWAPSGKRIAFVHFDRNGDSDIYTIRPQGSRLRRVTRGAQAYTLSYSPDGKRLAFGSWRAMDSLFEGEDPECYVPVGVGPVAGVVGECNFDIYVMRSDGSDVRQLTDSPGLDFWPEWSPDGQQIAFLSDRPAPTAANNDNIFIMSKDGSNQRRVTAITGYIWGLSWQPVLR